MSEWEALVRVYAYATFAGCVCFLAWLSVRK